jgi:hypothetical protein
MTMNSRLATIALVAGSVSAANAQLASFTYSDLLGSYDTNTNIYRAVAGDLSAGDVTRISAPGGSAQFDTGFVLDPTQANYEVELLIGNIQAGTADGDGTLVITDDNGDTITGNLAGEFRVFGGAVAYEGELSNVFFNDISGDGTFDGSTAGSFSTNFPANPPFDGSVVSLFFNPGDFFGSGFEDQITLSSGLIVPAPAGAAMLGLAGLVAARRRR